MYAAMRGHRAAIGILVQAGAQLDAQAHDGVSALMLAALAGHTASVRDLVAAGAARGLRNRAGHSAADLAKARGHRQIAELLKRMSQSAATASGPTEQRLAAVAASPANLLPRPSPGEFPGASAVVYEHPVFRGVPPSLVQQTEALDKQGRHTTQLNLQDGIVQRRVQGEKSVKLSVLGGLLRVHAVVSEKPDNPGEPEVIRRTTVTELSSIAGTLFPLAVGNRLRLRAIEKVETTRPMHACERRPHEHSMAWYVSRKLPGAQFGIPGDVFEVTTEEWRSAVYYAAGSPASSQGAANCERRESDFSGRTSYYSEGLGEVIWDPGARELGGWERVVLRAGSREYPIIDAGALTHGGAMAAASRGDIEWLRRWLSAGGDANADDVLTNAVDHDQARTVRALLDAGADPNRRHMETPVLSLAVAKNHASIVDLLLAKGADPNAPNHFGERPLAVALSVVIENPSATIIKALLAAGADPNRRKAEYSDFPLQVAISRDRADLALLLLDHGADPNRVNSARLSSNVLRDVKRNAAALMSALVKRGMNLSGHYAFGARNVNPLDLWFVPACGADSPSDVPVLSHAEGNDVVTVLLQAGARPSVQGLAELRNLRSSGAARLPSCQRLFGILRTYGIDP